MILEVPDVTAGRGGKGQDVDWKAGLQPMNEIFVDVGIFLGGGLDLIETGVQLG